MCRYVHPWVVDAHIEAHHLHVRDRPQASRILQASTALTCTLSYLFVHKGSSQLYIALRCHYIIKVSTLISLSFSEWNNDWIRPTGCRRHVSFMCLSLLPSISVERLLGNLTTSISRNASRAISHLYSWTVPTS